MTSVPNIQAGTLYVVATPIGNLADLSVRAQQVLSSVDVIACEDTRHTQRLLQHLGLRKALLSVHDHNERDRIEQVASQLSQGRNMALVSVAGNPELLSMGEIIALPLGLTPQITIVDEEKMEIELAVCSG